jgi:hypothetical protein
MNSPDNNPHSSSASPQPPATQKGSAIAGFFFGWLIMLLVGSTVFTIVGNDNGLGNAAMFVIPISLGIMISSIIWFIKKGKPKTAKGIVLSFVSLIALGLLLLAACYGIVSMM